MNENSLPLVEQLRSLLRLEVQDWSDQKTHFCNAAEVNSSPNFIEKLSEFFFLSFSQVSAINKWYIVNQDMIGMAEWTN